MTKAQLDRLFTENYKEYRTIARNHTFNKYETDVVMSNLYIHLEQRVDKIAEDKLKGYVVKYCSQLKYWTQNISPLLTERVDKKITVLDSEGSEVKVSMFVDIDIEGGDNEGCSLDFEDMQKELLKSFIKVNKIDHVSARQLKDYYEHNLDTYRKVQVFYRVSNDLAKEINKENGKLNKDFKQFVKQELNLV